MWVRVPDGFVPGPVWAPWKPDAGKRAIELGLRRLAKPLRQPLTFVVASDSHLSPLVHGAADLATVASSATALDPPPAFFTILGDITQTNANREFDMVDAGLAHLTVPWVPVPGNHDWYDGGATWSARYGPDNYSFDIANVHFVVWNMAMDDDSIRAYLGAELARVANTMTIVALTHAPPRESVVEALRDLGVDYVLTGHTHSNRAIHHDGILELNTQPLLMGGLDFTPAGYRVMTIANGRLSSYHRTTVDAPWISVVAPLRSQCAGTADRPSALMVAAEVNAATSVVTGLVDQRLPILFQYVGGHNWRASLPPLAPGPHEAAISARSATGARAHVRHRFVACTPDPGPRAGADWPQIGGGPTHTGALPRAIAPPLAPHWTTPVGGHIITASPAIAAGTVFVTVTDLSDGRSGGIVALELTTGVITWRVTTDVPVRGAVAVVDGVVVAPQIDGTVLGLDARTGTQRWRHQLGPRVAPLAAATFGSVAAIRHEVVIGHQRNLASIYAATGDVRWQLDPVPAGTDGQSLAAAAIGADIVVGTFTRSRGGVFAWDFATAAPRWQLVSDETIGINATPVIGDKFAYIVNAADTVTALELATGSVAWSVQLDPTGFAWGNATVGTPALARGVLVVPTLYRYVIALDATTGRERWRHEALPSPLRTTHYRGARQAGYAASPVITGDVVWIADTSGELAALDIATGAPRWRVALGAPVLSGLAASGDWLVVASYDGTVRALAPTAASAPAPSRDSSQPPLPSGSCAAGHPVGWLAMLAVWRRRRNYRRRRRRAITSDVITTSAPGRPDDEPLAIRQP